VNQVLKLIGGIGGATALVALASGGSSVSTQDSPPAISEQARPSVIAPVVNRKVEVPDSDCHSSYSGCLKSNAGDYDCAGGSGNGPNYTGRVEVYGSDPFNLDRDNDGWGCE
jgi:hypothetical protein